MPAVKTHILWRGLDRKRLRKAANALNSLLNRDDAMARTVPTFAPDASFFFVEDADTLTSAAMDRILARIQVCLDARTGA